MSSQLTLSPTLPTLPTIKVGSIDAYIRTVNQMPMLTEDREHELAILLYEQDNLNAAHELILSHLRLVVSIAREYLHYNLPQADLIQEGNIGLFKAVKKFNPNNGTRLSAFAPHWIKSEILEYIVRNWRLVKIATTKAQRKLFFNLRSMTKTLKSLSQDEIQDIALKLNVKPEDVIDMEYRFSGSYLTESSGGEHSDDGDIQKTPLELIPDYESDPINILENAEYERGQDISIALTQLNDRERRIIEARWLKCGDNPLTFDILGKELGLSIERVRQIEVAAIKKLKLALTVDKA
jgi:RNA polymerase sigma-32 factor